MQSQSLLLTNSGNKSRGGLSNRLNNTRVFEQMIAVRKVEKVEKKSLPGNCSVPLYLKKDRKDEKGNLKEGYPKNEHEMHVQTVDDIRDNILQAEHQEVAKNIKYDQKGQQSAVEAKVGQHVSIRTCFNDCSMDVVITGDPNSKQGHVMLGHIEEKNTVLQDICVNTTDALHQTCSYAAITQACSTWGVLEDDERRQSFQSVTLGHGSLYLIRYERPHSPTEDPFKLDAYISYTDDEETAYVMFRSYILDVALQFKQLKGRTVKLMTEVNPITYMPINVPMQIKWVEKQPNLGVIWQTEKSELEKFSGTIINRCFGDDTASSDIVYMKYIPSFLDPDYRDSIHAVRNVMMEASAAAERAAMQASAAAERAAMQAERAAMQADRAAMQASYELKIAALLMHVPKNDRNSTIPGFHRLLIDSDKSNDPSASRQLLPTTSTTSDPEKQENEANGSSDSVSTPVSDTDDTDQNVPSSDSDDVVSNPLPSSMGDNDAKLKPSDLVFKQPYIAMIGDDQNCIFVMKDMGVNLWDLIKDGTMRQKWLITKNRIAFFKDVVEPALHFSGLNLNHNDIRPKNIACKVPDDDEDGNDEVQYCLIDWDFARSQIPMRYQLSRMLTASRQIIQCMAFTMAQIMLIVYSLQIGQCVSTDELDCWLGLAHKSSARTQGFIEWAKKWQADSDHLVALNADKDTILQMMKQIVLSEPIDTAGNLPE